MESMTQTNTSMKQEQTHKRRKQTRGCQGRGKVAGMVGSGERGVELVEEVAREEKFAR